MPTVCSNGRHSPRVGWLALWWRRATSIWVPWERCGWCVDAGGFSYVQVGCKGRQNVSFYLHLRRIVQCLGGTSEDSNAALYGRSYKRWSQATCGWYRRVHGWRELNEYSQTQEWFKELISSVSGTSSVWEVLATGGWLRDDSSRWQAYSRRFCRVISFCKVSGFPFNSVYVHKYKLAFRRMISHWIVYLIRTLRRTWISWNGNRTRKWGQFCYVFILLTLYINFRYQPTATGWCMRLIDVVILPTSDFL